MRLSPAAAGFTALAVAISGCGTSTGEQPTAQAEKIAVVASTNVWASVVRAVGGDAVTVMSIINDPSADPHAYEAKPADTAALSAAKLVIYNGGGYDDFFPPLADSSGTSAKRIVTFDIAAKGPSGSVNEHVWYDLPSVRKVAEKVAEELGSVAPDRKGTFAGNAMSFATKLDELTTRVAQIGKGNQGGKPGAKVVFTEPIPEYLIETAGLTDVTPREFSEAIEEETDPPAAAVAEITGLVTAKQVAVLINNSQTETPVTKALKDSAARAGVPVVDVTETLPEAVTSYVDWMTGQVDALAGALAKT